MARSDKIFVTDKVASLETQNAMHAETDYWTEPIQARGLVRADLICEPSAMEITTLPDHMSVQPAFETFQPPGANTKLRAKELLAANEQLRAAQAELSTRLASLELRMTQQAAQQAEDARDIEAIIHALTCGQPFDRFVPQLLRYRSVSCQRPACRSISLDVPVAAAVGERLGIIADKRAEVHWDGPLPSVVADASLLQEILGHLLDNALMYVAPRVMPKVRIWVEKKQNAIRVYIDDNGVGIAAEDYERIFRLFERVNCDQRGAGVGLAIVRRAMNQMNGLVGVDSKPGAGSRFWIELPASP